jgi:hypothetical protein
MACDRIVWFQKEEGRQPTWNEIELVTKQFFGDAAKVAVSRAGERFVVTLVGKWSHPLRGVLPVHPGELEWGEAPFDVRVIEVVPGDYNVDIITRHQDQFTHACAAGLAKVFVLGWRGRLEDP